LNSMLFYYKTFLTIFGIITTRKEGFILFST